MSQSPSLRCDSCDGGKFIPKFDVTPSIVLLARFIGPVPAKPTQVAEERILR